MAPYLSCNASEARGGRRCARLRRAGAGERARRQRAERGEGTGRRETASPMVLHYVVPVKRLRRTENVRGTFEGVSAPRECGQPSPLPAHRTPYGSRHFRRHRGFIPRWLFVCVRLYFYIKIPKNLHICVFFRTFARNFKMNSYAH